MEFTVTTTNELTEKLRDEDYSEEEIETIVSMFESEQDGTEQTITVAAPK